MQSRESDRVSQPGNTLGYHVVLFPRSVRTHQSGPSPPVDAEDEAPADHRNWRTLVPWINPGGYRAGSRSFPADRRVRTVATGRYFLSYAYGREGGRYQGLEQQAERGMYVRLAASGEAVLVTDRDRVVAEMGPSVSNRSQSVADAHSAELARSGKLKPPLLAGSGPPRKPPPIGTVDEILRELDRDRAYR